MFVRSAYVYGQATTTTDYCFDRFSSLLFKQKYYNYVLDMDYQFGAEIKFKGCKYVFFP